MIMNRIRKWFNWRKWIVAGAFVAAASAQQSATVYTQIATSSVTTGVQATKPRSIGQSFHLLGITAKNIGGGCDAALNQWRGVVRLQGSFDNSNWQNIGTAIYSLLVDSPQYVTAAGSFPYLRVNYISGNTAVCALNIGYSGNITGSLSNNTITPINDGFTYFSTSSAATGAVTGLAISSTCPIGTRYTLYSLSVMNAKAVASSSTATLRFSQDAGATTFYSFPLEGLAAGASYTVGSGQRPIYQSAVATGIVDFLLNQAAADGFNITGVFRCE